MSIGLRAGTSNDGYIQINGVDRISINSTSVTFTGNVSYTNYPNLGQCRFQYTNSTTCTLVPYQGNLLSIGGVNYVIPSAGVTLSATGLTVSTLYYVYAWMNSTTMTLEASTTGHSTDTATGIEIKTGDATRTLVGMVYPTTGPVFQSSGGVQYVLSWFNRKPISSIIVLNSNITVTNTALTEIDVTYRALFLSWAKDNVNALCTGGMTSNSISTIYADLFITGAAATGNFEGGSIATVPTAGYWSPLACMANVSASADGQNYVGLKGASAAGTMTAIGGSTVGTRGTIQVVIQG